jgi:carboxymethylenebutenolidase
VSPAAGHDENEERAAIVTMLDARPLTLTAADGAAFAALEARAATPTGPALLLLPDARGLHPEYEALAGRFAAAGHDALAIDYFGRSAGIRDWRADFDWGPHSLRVRDADVEADIAAALDHLRPIDGPARPIVTVGFGVGASRSWLAAAGGLGLAGAIGFYGKIVAPMPGDWPAPMTRVDAVGCPVLGIFAARDASIWVSSFMGFERALRLAGAPHQIALYLRCQNGFFDRLAAEHPAAAADAWERVASFLRAIADGTADRLEPYVVVGAPPVVEPVVANGRPSARPQSATYCPPPESEGGWRVLSERHEIAARGLDPDRLEELLEWNLTVQHEPPHPPSHVGVVVIKDGWLVAERYDRPRTRHWPRGVASIGKSVSSCAFGRWVEAGRRGEARHQLDLDSLVYDPRWLPEGFPLSDPRKAAITFRHLFTHTSGLRPEPDTRGGVGFRFLDYTLGKSVPYPDAARLLYDPGAGYGYSSVSFNHLPILAPHLTGRLLHDEVGDEIFAPIGAESASWRTPDGEAFVWEDPDGPYMPAASGPHLTTRDLARYAYLHLHEGRWDGREVVPAWYMRLAREVTPLNAAQRTDYGLGFWSNHALGMSPDLPGDAFGLGGAGLNLVVIVPSWDLIVARASRVMTVDMAAARTELIRRVIELAR